MAKLFANPLSPPESEIHDSWRNAVPFSTSLNSRFEIMSAAIWTLLQQQLRHSNKIQRLKTLFHKPDQALKPAITNIEQFDRRFLKRLNDDLMFNDEKKDEWHDGSERFDDPGENYGCESDDDLFQEGGGQEWFEDRDLFQNEDVHIDVERETELSDDCLFE
jgi:hypothetical protein